mmetsp:Transcript_16864/g.42751  ORF Transcript_16864/g.42751 Transcript_16864/m.42751 type:complete len:235 (-) Transcript_16864:373-1077(-)|eukprot:jgi/Tetstr1/426819/TSEL_017034.t1
MMSRGNPRGGGARRGGRGGRGGRGAPQQQQERFLARLPASSGRSVVREAPGVKRKPPPRGQTQPKLTLNERFARLREEQRDVGGQKRQRQRLAELPLPLTTAAVKAAARSGPRGAPRAPSAAVRRRGKPATAASGGPRKGKDKQVVAAKVLTVPRAGRVAKKSASEWKPAAQKPKMPGAAGRGRAKQAKPPPQQQATQAKGKQGGKQARGKKKQADIANAEDLDRDLDSYMAEA